MNFLLKVSLKHIGFFPLQKLPLCATLSVPQMELSKESLDFGTCLVGQQRELQLMISNRTASHCHWRVYLGNTVMFCRLKKYWIKHFMILDIVCEDNF